MYVAADVLDRDAAGTWLWIDPVEDLIFVGMIQQFGEGRPDVRSVSRRLVHQSIIDAVGVRTATR